MCAPHLLVNAIEGRGRFVEDKERGVPDHGACDGNPAKVGRVRVEIGEI